MTQLRVAGYARTSGERQRDNTSIPQQRQAIEDYCKIHGFILVGIYVDESRSGSKVEGRDAYAEMIRDARQGKFDIILIHHIDRFNRAEIVNRSKHFQQSFNVETIAINGAWDTRNKSANGYMMNGFEAIIAESERLRIMERTFGGRVAKAKQGKPWSGNAPCFRQYNKQKGEWEITKEGLEFRELVQRYIDGESLADLAVEYGYKQPRTIIRLLNNPNISGPVYANLLPSQTQSQHGQDLFGCGSDGSDRTFSPGLFISFLPG